MLQTKRGRPELLWKLYGNKRLNVYYHELVEKSE